MNAPGRLVLVLGMHRSGTSALARGLRVLGIALGDDLLPAHPCNPKGFFEDAGLYAFNKALLTRLNLTWQSPEAPDAKVLHTLAAGPPGVAALDLLREKSAGQAVLGLKDPRMSRLLPFWRPVLTASGLRAHCVISLRHPDSVAHSLRQRDRLDPETGHMLWLAHMLDILEGCRWTRRNWPCSRTTSWIQNSATTSRRTPRATEKSGTPPGPLWSRACTRPCARRRTKPTGGCWTARVWPA